MPRVLKLRNSIQAYAWGSRTAIAELLGTPVPAEPQAELWMGAHPKAASEVWVDGAWRALDRMIEECGASILGSRVCAAFSGRLPFLFKILAAAEPLSIQAHPNKARAAAGFERENAAGLGLADPLRNYRDAHHKPEILYALTPFTALRGFLPAAEIDERLRASGLGAHLPGAREAGLSGFFSAFLNLEGGAVALAIEQALARSGRLGAESARWIERLAASYPGDRGALAPVFMRRVDLNPGEAVFTPPGVLHAYLEGVGVELMASSDNVLRGGLTRKHVEPDELMRIARFEVE
ncbi:MAG: mannose-6-phosphate isomerase, class I, partial [Acidobacteriota bacterium]